MNYKLMKHGALAAVLCLVAASCVDFDDSTGAVDVAVQLQMPEEFTHGSDLEGHTISMGREGSLVTATTDGLGLARFMGLTPNLYDISVVWRLSAAQYRELSGDDAQVSGATVAGSLTSQLVESSKTLMLPTRLSVDRDIVIGKVFYAASKDNNNRNYMAGKYLELYNQSNDTVDAAGLYIGLVEAESTQAYTLQNLHDDYADSLVLLKQVFRIPADKPFRVEPGGTVLLVNSATDHTTNNDQDNDLTHADFEAKDKQGRYANNPLVPALQLVFTINETISYMNLVQGGPCAVVIFRTDDDVTQWPVTYAHGKTSGSQWKLLPARLVIDGVDIVRQRNTGPEESAKRLYPAIDAGYTNIQAVSGWSGEVVYRRTSAQTGASGQRLLVDTNNSKNDFQVSKTIKPREYDVAK